MRWYCMRGGCGANVYVGDPRQVADGHTHHQAARFVHQAADWRVSGLKAE